jgi:hypothetical protein
VTLRTPLLIVSVTLLLAPSECWRVRDLVLVNSSDHPVTIRLKLAQPYSGKTGRGCPEGFNRPALATAPDSADLDPGSKAWVSLDTASVRLANAEYDLQVTVPSRTAVHVDELFDAVSEHRSCVDILEIENGNRIERFLGDDILRAFKKRNDILWVYKISA